jgi:hypothetical protein
LQGGTYPQEIGEYYPKNGETISRNSVFYLLKNPDLNYKVTNIYKDGTAYKGEASRAVIQDDKALLYHDELSFARGSSIATKAASIGINNYIPGFFESMEQAQSYEVSNDSNWSGKIVAIELAYKEKTATCWKPYKITFYPVKAPEAIYKVTTSEIPKDWKTYTNTTYKYELSLPKEITISEEHSRLTVFSFSRDIAKTPPFMRIYGMSREKIDKELSDKKTQEVSINGIAGKRGLDEDGLDTRWINIYLIHNNLKNTGLDILLDLQAGTYEEMELLKKVLGTIKFVE